MNTNSLKSKNEKAQVNKNNIKKERRQVRRLFHRTRDPSLKPTSEVRFKLKDFWNQNWLEFMNKMGKIHYQAGHFGRKFRSKKCPFKRQIPTLI
ncbi:hypothetical protein BpHYR1_025227 [Brachionus plicatilis]|uniref:Uncharacterized protein n=1 Tax=Brachionus plicatilis TaxID=10195 RepID=A0A3M7Q7J9_BRAPC|nr:hypothetical protein BpHYR1_025227 [Brachionus plicatilis]